MLESDATAKRKLEMAFKAPIMEFPPGVTFRRATKEDYQAVMELSPNTYDGTDILPGKYHHYLLEPKRYSYVAIQNGKVIAFTYHYVVDGGTTMYGGGARRHPAFKGQAICKALKQFATIDTLVAYPSVRKLRAVTYDTIYLPKYEPAMNFIPGSKKEYVTIAKSVPRNEFNAINTSNFATGFATELGVDKAEVRFAREEDLKEIFANPSLVKRVFPGSLINGAMDVFEPLVVNLPALFQKHKAITVGDDNLSVTVAEYYPAQVGSFFDLSLHGEASPEVAMAHFLRFAERCLDMCPAPEPLSIVVNIPEETSKKKFMDLCKRLPFYDEENPYDISSILAYEVHVPALAHL